LLDTFDLFVYFAYDVVHDWCELCDISDDALFVEFHFSVGIIQVESRAEHPDLVEFLVVKLGSADEVIDDSTLSRTLWGQETHSERRLRQVLMNNVEFCDIKDWFLYGLNI